MSTPPTCRPSPDPAVSLAPQERLSPRDRARGTGSGRVRVHRAWRVLGGATLALVTAGMFATLPGLLVEPLHHELGWSRGGIDLAVWVNLAVNGLTVPFAAAWMDRFGVRRVVLAGLLLAALGAAATTVLSSVWAFALCWGLPVGAGGGCVAMGLAATVADRWFVRRRGLATGILAAASVLGQFAFLPLLSLVAEQAGWRTAVAALAAVAVPAAVGSGRLLADHPADFGETPYGTTEFVPRPAPRRGAGRRALRVLADASRTPTFWLLSGTFAICGASTNGVMWSHFESAAHDHGMPIPVAASMLSLVGVFNVVGTVGSGWLTDRIDPRGLLTGYYLLRGLALFALPALFGPGVRPGLLVFVVLFGLLDVATVPPTIALSTVRGRYGTRDSAIIFGWALTAHQLGAGMVAFGGGVLRDLFGSYDGVWFGAALLCALAAALALSLGRTRPPREHPPAE